jgi:hypothetical protein
MISGIIDLEILEQPTDGIVGLKWKETREIFGKQSSQTMWITEAEYESFYYTRAENHGAIYMTKMSVKEVDGITQLSMYFSGTSESLFVRIISSIMSLFMKNTMIKLLEADLSDIKRFIEKG